MAKDEWLLWGSELSPYALKLALCCRHAQLPHRVMPTQGRWAENLRLALRLERLKRGALPLTWPLKTEDDEYPLVPYLFGPAGENLYDSSAIAEWLDRSLPEPRQLIPSEPLAAYVTRLVDDYADEFLLYVVHHQRWVVSARDNDAGARLAWEFRSLWGPAQGLMRAGFRRGKRGVCPIYLVLRSRALPLLACRAVGNRRRGLALPLHITCCKPHTPAFAMRWKPC